MKPCGTRNQPGCVGAKSPPPSAPLISWLSFPWAFLSENPPFVGPAHKADRKSGSKIAEATTLATGQEGKAWEVEAS